MNVAVERLPESQVVLDISTDEREFEKALDRAYRKVVNQVRLPGFRPGKAPRRIIEQLMGREVLIEQADRDLLDPLYKQALEQEQINPVSEPDVEIYQTEPLAFKVTVQVYPTVELGDYTSVRVEPRHVEVADEQVEETLAKLREGQSPWEEPAEPRAARDGDQVTLDVEIHEGEQEYREPLRGGTFVLGGKGLLPQLHEAILGMNVGETKDVTIAFAEDDDKAEADMRGKELRYRITLQGLKEQHLRPLDDDFAKEASSGRSETVDALRDEVRKDLLRAERQKARSEVGSEVVDAMAATAQFAVPAVMIDKQVDSEIENLRNHLSQEHGRTLEAHLRLEQKTLDQLREELRPEAARRLRNSLVLREIATREGVTVGPADIDAEIDRLVGLMDDPERMRQIYSNNYVRNLLENELFERNLMDRVIAIATEGRGAFEPPEEPEAEVDADAPDPEAVGATPTSASAAADEGGEAAPGEGPIVGAGGEVGSAEIGTPEGTPPAAVDDAAPSGGVLPADRHIAVGQGETAAASETFVPPDEGAAIGEENAIITSNTEPS